MKSYQIVYYEDDNEEAPFIQWLSALRDRKAAAIIKTRIDRLRFGLFGDAKYLDDDVFELRIHLGPGYRVYYTKHKEAVVVLLCGGDKSTQNKDIKRALSYCKLLKEEHHAKTPSI